MDLELELHLEERLADRVIVSLTLLPGGDAGSHVEGAAVQLVDAQGEALCPRVLVPVAGLLTGPLLSQVELRTTDGLPDGARIIATAWHGTEQVVAHCPAEPGLCLRDHVCGTGVIDLDGAEAVLGVPSLEERRAIEGHLAWLGQSLRPVDALGVIEVDDGPSTDDLRDNFGLDEAQAEWLRDLLDEE